MEGDRKAASEKSKQNQSPGPSSRHLLDPNVECCQRAPTTSKSEEAHRGRIQGNKISKMDLAESD
ncbi:conserved hypothetical protein [Ricinus communis]|uniref:Uncharacterized protein n=1 Tax=Ricinus communis TaxID=3988 RepID=B9S7T4_RICCO|nr:conserved hypothetical protein [Ricinus communis]